MRKNPTQQSTDHLPPDSPRLFSSGRRARATSRRHNEPKYQFLDTSGWPSVDRVREFWEGWFSQYDGTKKAGLAARFRSHDNHPHLSAFLELFTFAVLKRSGYEIHVEPAAGSKNLDFLASAKERDLNFYAECTATGQRADETSGDAREADILEAINRMPIAGFLPCVEFERRGSQTPSIRRLLAGLTSWFASLDHVAAIKQLRETNRLSEWTWMEADWRVKIRALPIEFERGRGKGALGIVGPRVFWDQERFRLREALDDKASKYGGLDAPLLVLINSTEYQQDSDLMTALVGDEVWDVDVIHNRASRRFRPNGVFGSRAKPRNVFLSTVMHGRFNVLSFASTEHTLVIVHHPFASRPLPRGLFPFCEERHFDSVSLQMVTTPPTMSVGEFFGLPRGWPFFDKDPH